MALWKLSVILIVSLCLTHSAQSRPINGEQDSFIPACAMRSDLVPILKAYGEEQTDWEVYDKDLILEMWVNRLTGKWAVLSTSTAGGMCLISEGYWSREADL